MADRPLGRKQQLILGVLAQVPDDGVAPTPAEIVQVLARSHPWFGATPVAEAELTGRCLRRLARRGLVERLGTTATGARCWRITPAGRQALEHPR